MVAKCWGEVYTIKNCSTTPPTLNEKLMRQGIYAGVIAYCEAQPSGVHHQRPDSQGDSRQRKGSLLTRHTSHHLHLHDWFVNHDNALIQASLLQFSVRNLELIKEFVKEIESNHLHRMVFYHSSDWWRIDLYRHYLFTIHRSAKICNPTKGDDP